MPKAIKRTFFQATVGKDEPMRSVKMILHPTDFSDAALEAMDLAHALARDQGATLVVLGVAAPQMSIAELRDAEMIAAVERLHQQLSHLISTIRDASVQCDAVQGLPGQAIVTVANEINADLIVMGTQGRRGVSRLLLGSVAEYVMRNAKCSVVTVKPPAATTDIR